MKLGIRLAILSVFLTAQAMAGVLETTPGSKMIEEVPISSLGVLTVEGRKTPLTTVGSGLRKKKVAIIKVKVYVAQLLVSDPASFNKASPMASVDKQKAIAARMTFLRGVDAAKIANSFKEALAANEIDLNRADLKGFLDAVQAGGDVESKQTLTVTVEKLKDGSEVVTYENGSGVSKSIHGQSGLMKAIASIWMGKNMGDSGLEDLRKELLS